MTSDVTANRSAAAPPPVPRAYTKIDWKQAAERIAGGQTVAETAAALGLPADRIWRHLNRSLRFRFYLRQAIERQRLEAEIHLAAAARETVLARSRDPAGLDGDSLQWLAAESGLAGGAGRRAAERAGTTEDLVMQMAATGNRPPNQTLRRRLAAKQAAMDRFMADAQTELSAAAARWRAAEGTAGAAAETAAAAAAADRQEGNDGQPDEPVHGGRQRSKTVASGPQRSETVTSGPQRSETVASGAQRTATISAGPEPGAGADDAAPWPSHMPRPSLHRSITDLPPPRADADGAGPPHG